MTTPIFSMSSNLPVVRKSLRKYKATFDKGTFEDLKATAVAVQKFMSRPGKKAKHPMDWDSARQMRAFFASNGFGGGIPHVRRGRYTKGWKIKTAKGKVSVYNTYRNAKFIAGMTKGGGQSATVKGRWPLFADAIKIEVKGKLPGRIKKTINANAAKAFKKRT